jgi:DNA polymerase III subunit delta
VLYVFHGPDQFSAREELSRLVRELDTDGNLANQTVRLEGGKITPADLLSASHTASFFAENRLVIVEGLLTRLSGERGGRRRSAKQRGNGAASLLDRFLEALTNVPPTTTVVLLDERASASALAALSELGRVRAFPVLRPNEFQEWARLRLLARGGRISGPAVQRLCQLVDAANIATLASEIDKLIAYVGDRPIEVADVEEMVSGAVDYMPWDMTDAVIAGRADRALSVVQRMSQRDQPPQVLLFMLARTYRQLILAQAMLKEGLPASEIGKRLGMNHPFQVQKVVDQATRYPAARLEQAYRRILETDVAVKTGVLDVELALDMLIAELAQHTAGSRGRSAAYARSGRG